MLINQHVNFLFEKCVITINIKIYASITSFQRFLNVIRFNQCPECTLCQIHNDYTIKT